MDKSKEQELASGRAADNHHLHQSPAADEASRKSIRFFEYASVIPLLDPEQLHEHVVQAYGHHGRPHLSSRTYSVPIPSSFTSLFASPSPREYTYDPSFIPNAPPRLNLKLPSFVRKRRNTIPCQSHLKSILKKRKPLISGIKPAVLSSPDTTGNSGSGRATTRGRSHTVASSAPVSSPSASCAIANINPVYCPALAKVVTQTSEARSGLASGDNLPSSPTTSQLSSSPSIVDTVGPPAISPTLPLPPETTEIIPIRDCCRACRKAATYGERCPDSTYYENWTKAALEKRKRDEEAKYERGESVPKTKIQCRYMSRDSDDEAHEPGRDVVHDVEKLQKEEARRRHRLPSPSHSPHRSTSPSSHSTQDHDKTEDVTPVCTPPVLGALHAHVVAQQEARHEKKLAHEEELDAARQRIARLDLGKKPIRHEEDEDEDEAESPCSEGLPSSTCAQEGDELDLEGLDGVSPRRASSSGTHTQDGANHSKTSSCAVEQEEEKNPICTLEGQALVPLSSRSLYTGGPSLRSPPSRSSPTAMASVSEAHDNADRVSNASSSDLSDDLVSNLSSLGLSPASATTNASSWLSGAAEELQSPPLRSLKEGAGEIDYFSSSKGDADTEHHKEEVISPPSAPPAAPSTGSGCSPLMRSKACLRPIGMYASLPGEGEDAMAQSCPTIREESQPSTPTVAAVVPTKKRSLHRASTTPTIYVDAEQEMREALKEADRPLFTTPARTQSLPAESGRGRNSPTSPLSGGDVGSHKHRPSWTSRILHPSRALSSLGVAHGIVH